MLFIFIRFRDKYVQMLISISIIFLFSFYLIYDIQKLTSKYAKKYTIDDYIVAALELYIDFLIIFKEILVLIILLSKKMH